MKKRYALYIRKSNDDRKTEDTLTAQKEEVIRWAKDNNFFFESEDIYVETISGKALLKDRVELVQMLSHIDRYEGIIARDSTRLARSAMVGYTIIETLASNKKTLTYSRTGQTYQFKDYFEIMISGSKFASDGSESHEMLERLKAGKDNHSRRGAWVCSTAPYGYKKTEVKIVTETGKEITEKTLEPIEKEADVIRLIYQKRLEGMGVQTIAKYLEKIEIESPRKRGWTDATVRRILSNQIYIGITEWGKTRARSVNKVEQTGETTRKKVRDKQKQSIVSEGLHEAIIDKDTFDQVQAMSNHRTNTPTGKQNSPLANLLFCRGCCHALSRQQANGSRHPRYTHRANSEADGCFKAYQKSIKEDEVINALMAGLKSDLKNIKSKVDCGYDNREETKAEVEVIDREIKESQERLDKLIDLLTDLSIKAKTGDKITQRQAERIRHQCEEIEAKLDTLETKKREIEEKKQTVETESDMKEIIEVGLDYVERIAKDPKSLQTHAKAFNQFLRTFIKRLEIEWRPDGTVHLFITYLGHEDKEREDLYRTIRTRGQKHRNGH